MNNQKLKADGELRNADYDQEFQSRRPFRDLDPDPVLANGNPFNFIEYETKTIPINVLNEPGARIRDVFWEISDLADDLDDTVIMGMKKIDEYGNWIIKLSNTTNKNLSVKVYSLQEIIFGYITLE